MRAKSSAIKQFFFKYSVYTWGLMGLFCLVWGIIFEQWAKNPVNISFYQERLQKALSQQEQEVLDLFNNGTFILNAVQNTTNPDTVQRYEAKPYTILVFDEKNNLLFWNNNKAFPYNDDITSRDPSLNIRYRMQGTEYLFLKSTYNPLINGIQYKYTLIGLIPIYQQYSIPNNYLKNRFTLLPAEFSEYVTLSEEPNDWSIKNSATEPIIYIQAQPNAIYHTWAWWSLFFYLLASGSLVAMLYRQARHWVKQYSFWWGLLLLIAGVSVFRAITFYFQFPNIARHFPLFSEPFTFLPHWWSNSMGEFLMEVVVAFMFALFLHKEMRLAYTRKWTITQKYSYGIGVYLFIGLAGWIQQSLLSNIIFDSNISFQFNNISQIDTQSFLALASVSGLFMSFFIISHQFFYVFRQFQIPFRNRLGLLAIALLIQIVFWLGLGVSWQDCFLAIVFGILYSGLLSWYVQKNTVSLAWISVWLLYFSSFTTVIFEISNTEENLQQHRDFAKTLAYERDEQMEERFLEVETDLLKDDFCRTYFTNPLAATLGASYSQLQRTQLLDRIKYRYLDNYFFGSYNYSVALFNQQGEPSRGEKRDYGEFVAELNKSQSAGSPNLHFISYIDGHYKYIARLPIERADTLVGMILIEFTPKQVFERGNIYVELMRMPKTRIEDLYTGYQYSLYKQDRRVAGNSSKLPAALAYDFPTPKADQYQIQTINQNSFLLYRHQNNNLSVVRLEQTGWNEWLTIFSYIFCFGVMLVILFGVLIWILRGLFGYELLDWNFDASLRERVQRGILLVSLISFIAIAIITIFYFRTEYTEYHKNNLTGRIESASKIASLEVKTNFDSFYVLPNAKALSEVTRLDVNIYDLKGQLNSTSEDNVFERRLISRRINPVALYKLQVERLEQFIQTEQIGNFTYLSAYVLIKDECAVPIAYLNLPYDSENSNNARSQDVATFLGTLLNVYVLFLILAGVAALVIAGSLTRPLSIIGEKLRQVKLDKKNEPIEWNVRDEIGSLVERYNQMILALEASKQELERTERESAWRDMAKQVAHEIKNPLTPMKLNIQLLQKLFSIDPEKARKKMDGVINGLIEQIDNLAHIASEFSNFAKMPTAQNELFALNELVVSVYELFKEESDMRLYLDVTDVRCVVLADKNQLMRVLNNLVKNSIQAITTERVGEIRVSLKIDRKNAVIQVQDNGCGMSEERQKKVFQPYFTTKSSGSGIGLAMCQTIVEMAKGRIYFVSEVDKGSIFTVELPLAE